MKRPVNRAIILFRAVMLAWMLLFPYGLLQPAAVAHAAEQASLYGMITDDQTKLPIDGVDIVAVVPGGEQTYTARTDGFGMFRIDGIEPGSYTLEANHPGYHKGSDADFAIASTQQNRWQKELTLKAPFFDIFVEVACVTTGMKLKNVPVVVNVTQTVDGNDIVRTGRTDDMGFLQFTGMPRGTYSFSINEGADNGWESSADAPFVMKELTGPHWVDARFKPKTSYIVASVYGFNPVTEEENVPLEGIIVECEGVHPDDSGIVLVPAQVGVSGIRKEGDQYWDNTLAGKVRFEGLPHIHWLVRGKRLGYKMSETKVTAIPKEDLRIDMALQDTKLTVIVDTPYNDPEMLAGLKVRLQGLKNSNTEGIDRIRTVEYQAAQNRAIVVFDKILPGNYLVAVDDSVTKTVSILVGGEDIQAGKTNPSNRFTVHFTALDYMDAFADTNREVVLFLAPEPLRLTGHLNLGSVEGIPNGQWTDTTTQWHAKPYQKVEIRASEYYAEHMPQESRLIEVTTDDAGTFTISLLPGLYGVVIHDLDDYWGNQLILMDPDSRAALFFSWPYYQTWPYSKLSADSYNRPYLSGGIGGIGFSSDQNMEALFRLSKKQFIYQMNIDWVPNDITLSQLLYSIGDDVNDQGAEYLNILNGGTLSVSGPENLTAGFHQFRLTDRVVGALTGSVPGTYTIAFNHPYYELQPGSLESSTLEWPEFPNPGVLPATAFPEDYEGPWPTSLTSVWVDATHKDLKTASIEVYRYNSLKNIYELTRSESPRFIRFSHTGNKIFSYRNANSEPYTVWYKYGIIWYRLESPGGDWVGRIYYDGPDATSPLSSFNVSYDLVVEAWDIDNPDDRIEGVNVVFSSGASVTTSGTAPVTLNGMAHHAIYDPFSNVFNYTHASWSPAGYQTQFVEAAGQNGFMMLTLKMRRGNSLRGTIINGQTGKVTPGAKISISLEAEPFRLVSKDDGTFAAPYALPNYPCFIDVRADGFEPYRKRLDPADAAANPEDPKTGAFIFTGGEAIPLTPLKRPVISQDTLTMNRRGAFLPGVKRTGNQTIFNAFSADGALTMTWGLDVGLAQKDYTVTLPGFDNADGSPGASQTLALQDGIREVWLVDMKSFPENRYDEEPVLLSLSSSSEPGQVAAFLKNIRSGAEGFKNVYYQRLTDFTADAANPDVAKVTGKVKLWQLPPDLFRPAFIVVTKLGAVNVYPLEYTGAWAGKELTGARLPAWFAGMQDIMGTVAGYQGMLGSALKEILPEGKIIALPTFTGNVILRATNTLDYIYSIGTQIKEGMADELGGILGLAPGFLGLSLYGGAEAILKGEDREFFLRITGGVNRKSVNKKDYMPHFMKNIEGARVELTPAPSGEFQSINSFKFDPDNRPDELAVLYGVSGKTGVEVSGSIFPVLKYIPKIGPVLYMLYKSGAIDIRVLSKGLIGVRSLSGFKTTFPHQEEHYPIQGAETKQRRRHFLGGNEVGDPAKEQDPQKPEKLQIAFGFGVGTNLLIAGGSAGAKGTLEIAGDDVSWTGVPALLIDVNPNGDWPIVQRIRGDLRAVLDAYLQAWVVRFQKKWFWKLWPIDYQFGTESTLKLIEMEIITSRRDLAGGDPAEFKNESPVVVDKASPLTLSRIAGGTGGDLLLYTDVAASGGDMVLKASLRQSGQSWGTPVTIGQVAGVVVNAAVIALKQGGWLAVWTEIARDQADGLYPPSKIMYTVGNAEGTLWTGAVQAVGLENVADAAKLIPHGDGVALIYTEKKEGPTGGGDGLNAVLWDGNAWSEPRKLTPSAVDAFDALGSDDLSQRPTLVAYRDGGNNLHLLEWAENLSDPLLMKEEAGGALAFTRHNDRTYLAYSMKDGGIGFFHRDGGTGPWTDRGILFPEAAPRELSLTVFRENGRDLVVAAWTESDGVATHLRYGAFDATDETIKTTAPVTTLAAGDFRSPALHGTDGALELTAILQQADGVNQIHIYRLSGLMNSFFGDINLDGIVDLQDFIIVLRILVNDGPADIPGKPRADVNQSGKIDLGDAIHILRVLGTR